MPTMSAEETDKEPFVADAATLASSSHHNVSSTVDMEEDCAAETTVNKELERRLSGEDEDDSSASSSAPSSPSPSGSGSKPPLNRDDSIETLTKSALEQEVSEMRAKELEADRTRRLEEYDWDFESEEENGEKNEEEEDESEKFSMARIARKSKFMPPTPPKKKEPETPPPPKTPPPPPPSLPQQPPIDDVRAQEGFLVWALLKGYPYWPGIVTVDPVECITAKRNEATGGASKIHVHFLGYPNRGAWVEEAAVMAFDGREAFEAKKEAAGKAKKADYTPNKKHERVFERGITRAEEVFPLTLRQRLKHLHLEYVLIDPTKAAEEPKVVKKRGRKRKAPQTGNEDPKEATDNAGTPSTSVTAPPAKRKRTKSAAGGGEKPKKKPSAQNAEGDKKTPKKKGMQENAAIKTPATETNSPMPISKSSDEGFEEATTSGSNNTAAKSTKPKSKGKTKVPRPPTPMRKRRKTDYNEDSGEELKYLDNGDGKEEPTPARRRQSVSSGCASPVRPTPLPLPSVAVTSPAPGLVDEIVDIHDTGGDDLESNDDEDNEDSNASREPKLGSLVWGKLPGFPFWPCFVTQSPDGEYVRRNGKYPQFHVQFFNWNDESGWVTKALPWRTLEEFKQYTGTLVKSQRDAALPKGKGMEKKWTDAFLLANATANMSRKERYTDNVVHYGRGKAAALHEQEIVLGNLAKVKPHQQQQQQKETPNGKVTASSSPATMKKRRKNSAGVERCGRCSACKADDCRGCLPCRNKVKNGGTGSMNNICCLKRRCTTKGYGKSWTVDEDKVEVAGVAKTSRKANMAVKETTPPPAVKKRKKPTCSPQKKAKSAGLPPQEKSESEPDEDDPSSAGVFRKFLSRLYPSDLPKGWTLDTKKPGKASMTQMFQSPEGQTFNNLPEVVSHLFQQNVASQRKRSLSCSGQESRSVSTPAGEDSEKGWLLRYGDKMRYGEQELTTSAAGDLAGRFRYFEDRSLPQSWLVKHLRAKGKMSSPDHDVYLYTYTQGSSNIDGLSFTSKVETASYLESKGHPALELEHFTSICAQREHSHVLLEAAANRQRSRVSVLVNPYVPSKYTSHPILAKAVQHSYVDLVKLPDIFLDHPTVNVRETSNEMVITDVDTEEFIAKKIMYE